MKKYFEEQLNTSREITEKNLKKLKGMSQYGEYKIEDRILLFLEQVEIEKGKHINLNLQTCVAREFIQLEKDFKFIRMANSFPVLERK